MKVHIDRTLRIRPSPPTLTKNVPDTLYRTVKRHFFLQCEYNFTFIRSCVSSKERGFHLDILGLINIKEKQVQI
jgi:hypothetical protein